MNLRKKRTGKPSKIQETNTKELRNNVYSVCIHVSDILASVHDRILMSWQETSSS